VVRPGTPTRISFDVLDDEGDVVYSSDQREGNVTVAPGSPDGFSQLLSPFLLGLHEGESMETVAFDSPFGEPRTYLINRTLWQGEKVQTIDASAVDHIPVGGGFTVEPINLTAKLVERNASGAVVDYQVPNTTLLHPSNLNLSVTTAGELISLSLDHDESETLYLKESCQDLVGIPSGWYRVDNVNDTFVEATYFPVRDAGTLEAARTLSTRATSINFTVEKVYASQGEENRANLTDREWFQEIPQYLEGVNQITYDREIHDISSNPRVREI